MCIQFSVVDARVRFLPAFYHSERAMLFGVELLTLRRNISHLWRMSSSLPEVPTSTPAKSKRVCFPPSNYKHSQPPWRAVALASSFSTLWELHCVFSSLCCFLSAHAARGTDSSQYKYEPESHYEGPFSEKPNTIGLCGDIPKRIQSSLRQEWIQELKLSLLYLSYFWLCGLVWLHFLLLSTAMGCRECQF